MKEFYVYKEARINNQTNDKCTVNPHIVFETLTLKDTDRTHITLQQPILPYIPQSHVLITRIHT